MSEHYCSGTGVDQLCLGVAFTILSNSNSIQCLHLCVFYMAGHGSYSIYRW